MIDRHKNPARIGMTFKLDAEHIEAFALTLVGDFVHTRRGRDFGLVAVYCDS